MDSSRALVPVMPSPLALSGPKAWQRQRASMAALVLTLAVFVAGGLLVPIGGAVIGSGSVGSTMRDWQVAHPTGGVIAEVLATPGQQVRKGEVLLRFDDAISRTDAAASSLNLEQLLAHRARLEAEQAGMPSILFPAALRPDEPQARRAIEAEQGLFRSRLAEQQGISAQLRARSAQYEQQIRGIEAQIAAVEAQRRLIVPELEGLRQLREKGLVTIGRLNQAERSAEDLRGSVGALQASIAQARVGIAEMRERSIQLTQTARVEAGRELSEVNQTLSQQQVRSIAAEIAQDRASLRAPHDGVVDKLMATSPGAVVRPAEAIMEVVPDTDLAVIEGMVQPGDVTRLRTGQAVRVRFTGLVGAASPEVTGRLQFVAANKSSDAQGLTNFYPVRIALAAEDLAKQPGLRLRAGMPAEFFITTGERSLLSYLTKPLRDQFARAFRDD